MKWNYVVLVVSNYYPPMPILFAEDEVDAIDYAEEKRAFYERPNVDAGDNKVVVKRKLY